MRAGNIIALAVFRREKKLLLNISNVGIPTFEGSIKVVNMNSISLSDTPSAG